eukprot:413316_1
MVEPTIKKYNFKDIDKHVDFSVYDTVTTICDKFKNRKDSISNCFALKRISTALKYFDVLFDHKKINQTTNTKEIFVHFCMHTYRNFLDDLIHCIKEHADNEQLENIKYTLINKYGLKQCDLARCIILKRHYRETTKENKNINEAESDIQFDFYCGCYDRIHHLFFHLFSMGLRMKPTEIPHFDDSDETDTISSCVDKVFSQFRDLAHKRRNECKFEFSRYNEQNNKYNLQTTTDVSTREGLLETNETFLDGMYRFIQHNNNITENQLNELKQYITTNEYDSDVIYDEIDSLPTCNIYNNIKNKLCLQLIAEYTRNIELSTNSFSTGFVFFYWKHYKTITKKEIGDRLNGYSPSQLFILPEFKSLKEEILYTGLVSLQLWNKDVVFKGDHYHRSERVKNIRRVENENHHDIIENAPISSSHLYTIILYCDFSELSSLFSGTFRKKQEFEQIQSLKTRQSKFYHFSKGLVEAVTDFGTNGRTYSGGECGPFYCGLKIIINIPSFSIYLKGPCSTTMDFEIAINFGTRDGMMLSFQNDQWHEGMQQNFFDCSFISNYIAENERLFIASEKRLRLEKIIIIESAKNYEDFAHAFHAFDHMISGVDASRIGEISKSDVLILDKMISSKLKMQTNGKKK